MALTMYYITSNNKKWMRFKQLSKKIGADYLHNNIIFERISYPDSYVKDDSILSQWKLTNFIKEFTVPAIVEHSYFSIRGTVIDDNIERIFPYNEIYQKFNKEEAVQTQYISYTFGKSIVTLKSVINGEITKPVNSDNFLGWLPIFVPKFVNLSITRNGKEVSHQLKEKYTNDFFIYNANETMSKQDDGNELNINNALHAILFDLLIADLKNGEKNYFDNLALENIKCIADLKYRISKKQIILFIGAGLSRTLGLVGWRDLVKAMGRDLGFNDDIFVGNESELLVPAEYYSNKKSLADIIKKEFIEKAHDAIDNLLNSPIYKKIYDLNFPTIYTTNYDDFIEKYYELKRKEGYLQECFKVIKISDCKNYDDKKTAIIKLHGDYSNLDDIVLSEKSFYTRMDLTSSLDSLFKADMIKKSVLFFGYSLTDINVRNWINKLSLLWDGNEANRNDSYFYNHCFNQVQSEILNQKGIRTITTCLEPYSIKSSDMLKHYINNNSHFHWIQIFIDYYNYKFDEIIDFNKIAEEIEEKIYMIDSVVTRYKKEIEFNLVNDRSLNDFKKYLNELDINYAKIILCYKMEYCNKNCLDYDNCKIKKVNSSEDISDFFQNIKGVIKDNCLLKYEYFKLLEKLLTNIKLMTDEKNIIQKFQGFDQSYSVHLNKIDTILEKIALINNLKSQSIESLISDLIIFNYIYIKTGKQNFFTLDGIFENDIKGIVNKLSEIQNVNNELTNEILYISLNQGIYHKIAMEKFLSNLLDEKRSYNQFNICIKLIIYDDAADKSLIFKRRHNRAFAHTWENYGKCIEDYESIQAALKNLSEELEKIKFIHGEDTIDGVRLSYVVDLDKNLFENIVCVASFDDSTVKTLVIAFLAIADLSKFGEGQSYNIYFNDHICSNYHEVAECYAYNDMVSVILPEINEEFKYFKTKNRIDELLNRRGDYYEEYI